MLNLIMLGAPGAGKGTQSKFIVAKHGIPQISTGDMLRAAVKDGSALGAEAQGYMEKGMLVPDSVIIGLVEERIQAADCQNGFILDGFPRTVAQAEALGLISSKHGHPITAVLNISVPVDELIARLTGRRVCKASGHEYHIEFKKPIQAGICDIDGSELYQRADDSLETIKKRLEVYETSTKPLIEFYTTKGIIKNIPGSGSSDSIFSSIEKVIA